ncbi:hypothetical protein CYMTET_12380 [Cymbomonas tetramitiformis]|uniref:Uncharacterized protein n=1 Tax=Cymbomonas tetramitiformis TaxID=36881 RepID=A0AAE0GK79_9CHLO|nr:hypothetical protein CYMTET_12380 [Cymbomonas tetramitiformis]
MFGWFCYSCLAAENKAELDGRECHWCDCVMSGAPAVYYTRAQMRAKYALEQDPILDFTTACFFGPCVNCQTARILRQVTELDVQQDTMTKAPETQAMIVSEKQTNSQGERANEHS